MRGVLAIAGLSAALLAALPASARVHPFDAVPLPIPRPSFPADAPDVPLPPQRPVETMPVGPVAPVVPVEAEAACAALIAGSTVVATRLPPIVGPDGCGIANPVELSAIRTISGAAVAVAPSIRVRCELARALADWVRDDLAAITAPAGDLRGIVDADAYECRGRNRVAGAKLSEHGKGNAVDIVALTFADGHRLTLTAPDAGPAVAAIKASACRRFTTVLGPGSDGYHESHVHLDLEPRRGGASLCEWTLPELKSAPAQP